tara:strand:- start:114 stop:773 length:660 start_codon:yes stop_codon:yes gene_type:complete
VESVKKQKRQGGEEEVDQEENLELDEVVTEGKKVSQAGEDEEGKEKCCDSLCDSHSASSNTSVAKEESKSLVQADANVLSVEAGVKEAEDSARMQDSNPNKGRLRGKKLLDAWRGDVHGKEGSKTSTDVRNVSFRSAMCTRDDVGGLVRKSRTPLEALDDVVTLIYNIYICNYMAGCLFVLVSPRHVSPHLTLALFLLSFFLLAYFLFILFFLSAPSHM